MNKPMPESETPQTPPTPPTPTPWAWYWRVNTNNEPDCGIFGAGIAGRPYSVARCPRYQSEAKWTADAAFICETINTHADLIAALRLIAGAGDQEWLPGAECKNIATDALKKAGIV